MKNKLLDLLRIIHMMAMGGYVASTFIIGINKITHLQKPHKFSSSFLPS